MNSQGAWQRTLDFGVLPVVVEPVTASFSTDAGLLPMRQCDERLGLTEQFAAAINDPRAQDRLDHPILEMVRSRVFGILAGYEDCNDHDSLRSDPIFKLLAGRSPDDEDLASQPTLSRFENLITTQSLFHVADVFLSQFLDSVTALGPDAPRHLTLDLDVFDDPTHGAQQLTFFHGFYEQYQYMSRLLTCANNDQIAVVALWHGTARATLGAADDVKRVVTALRERWPGVQIHLRTDSGFATPQFFLECEQLVIDYTSGLPMNAVLKRQTDETLAEAVRGFEQTGQPQRLFEAFEYQAESWDQPRWVVVKCEANAQGTNRRAVVTNRPGARIMPAATYDEYGERGESENRNKEVKCGFHADRLSCHRTFRKSRL